MLDLALHVQHPVSSVDTSLSQIFKHGVKHNIAKLIHVNVEGVECFLTECGCLPALLKLHFDVVTSHVW